MVLKSVLCASVLSLGLSSLVARAQPMPVLEQPHAGGNPDIVLVYGGCGPYGHRGPYGGCRPGGQYGGYRHSYACPPGFHLGAYGRHCWPN